MMRTTSTQTKSGRRRRTRGSALELGRGDQNLEGELALRRESVDRIGERSEEGALCL